MKAIITAVLTLLLFTACSQKSTLEKQQTVLLIEEKQNKTLEEESFDDEFSEEKTQDLDPLEYYNRAMTNFNDVVYTYALIPAANVYKKTIHEEVQISISNFFTNLMFPIRFVNNILQLKFQEAGEETGRFLLNTTIGFFGFFDPATETKDFPLHKEDFGQTLGYWGVGPGFHIVLPIFGPSNVRDLLGFTLDGYIDPGFSTDKRDLKLPNNLEKSLALKTLATINQNALNNGQYENLKKDALDLYPFLKNIYEQKRLHEIKE